MAEKDTGAPTDTEPPKADEVTNTTESPKSGKKGKKDAPPKKKKLSKKELARIKREKAEQEKREQERLEAEKRALQEQEEEQKKRNEQQQRLLEEQSDIQKIRKDRVEKGLVQTLEREKLEDWDIFSKCDHGVDVRSEADVNTFISQWGEIEENDMTELFDHIHQSLMISNLLKIKAQHAELEDRKEIVERCRKQMDNISTLIKQKIENITSYQLVFSDKFATSKSEVQINGGTDDITYGMWVNLSKNPRIKDINLCTGVSVEIPKPIAMASIAIRAIRSKDRPFNEKYLFIDRVLQCDFLQLPAPPKRVGNMVLRHSPQNGSLVKITYPLRNVTAPQPPLNFKMSLEDITINDFTSDATIVMIKVNEVTTNKITKCAIDNGEVLFSASAIGTFCLAVPRYRNFPFQFWEISGQSPTSVEIYIQTAVAELAFTIGETGLVSMEAPFQFNDLTPTSTLEFLEERGINLVAPNAVEGITPKDEGVEDVLHNGIADCAVGFSVRCSKWNTGLPPDRAMLLVREKFNYDEEINEEKDEENIANSKAILVKAFHVTEVKNTEREDTCSQKPPGKDPQIHQHLLPMFFDGAREEVRERVRATPALLCNSVLFFMKRLRLFSMTQ